MTKQCSLMFHGVLAGFRLLIFKGLKKVSHIFVMELHDF